MSEETTVYKTLEELLPREASEPVAKELTLREFFERWDKATDAMCHNELELVIYRFDQMQVSARCRDGCSSRSGSGHGETLADAFLNLLEGFEEYKRLERIKAIRDGLEPELLDRAIRIALAEARE